jgi:hypothetical protein
MTNTTLTMVLEFYKDIAIVTQPYRVIEKDGRDLKPL